MRISDWSSDVCSSDLLASDSAGGGFAAQVRALGLGGESTVITGNGVAADDAVQWAAATLDRLNGKTPLADANLLRPTPETADRKSVVAGKSGAGREEPGGRRILKQTRHNTQLK